MKNTIISLTDSYKMSHFEQYEPGTQIIHSYLESRGGEYDKVVFVGLQYLLKEYLSKPITQDEIDEIAQLCAEHGEPFYKEGWEYILKNHNGYLPVTIKALPEGSVVTPKTVLLTIENINDNEAGVYYPWLTSFLETLLLKVWYPITIASKSYAVRKMIESHHQKSMDDLNGVAFAFHNFGDRGSSSVESAAWGGFAHLTQFLGTDNFNSIKFCKDYYNSKSAAGFSIPASEHSTVTSWGKDREYDMIANYLEKSKNRPIIACVLDSYDIYKAVEFVTTSLKDKIESDEYPIFVIRPDSGEPISIIDSILNIMEKNNVSFTVNTKGFKMFNKFRIIWGDGITPQVIDKILSFVESRGYAAGNLAFGSGGNLMQQLDRDTLKMAIKCSAAVINDIEREVFKDPITDKGKTSKKGRQTVIRWKNNDWQDKKASEFQTIRSKDFNSEIHEEVLVEVFRNGKILVEYSMDEIRLRATI